MSGQEQRELFYNPDADKLFFFACQCGQEFTLRLSDAPECPRCGASVIQDGDV